MAILSEYSLWFIFLCLAIGVIYSFILYYKNRSIEYGKRTTIIMATLRALSTSMICILLLAPMLKRTVKNVEKPIIVLGVDNSESILLGSDSTWYQSNFNEAYRNFVQSLGKKYDIVQYSVGEGCTASYEESPIQLDFHEKTTNLSELFDVISTQYSNQNLGAVVFFSDGIYNYGSNPYYKASRLNAPIYTVGMGNPNQQTDLIIAGITHNKKTFKGNLFPVEIKISAAKLSGKQTKLSVYDADNEIFTKNITISSDQFFETVKLSLEAKENGTHRYRVEVTSLDGEINYSNNKSSFFIEVVDQRERIAIIYDSPHPDVAAIKSALEKADKYQLDVFSVEKFNEKIENYSLIILHQLPSGLHPASQLLTQINNSRVSTLFILGGNTNLNLINSMNLGVTIAQNKRLVNDAIPFFNPNFNAFTFSDESKNMLAHFPPISVPFGNYQLSVGTHVFMQQQISGVQTNYPLILFNSSNNRKTGLIAGTGIWQWKLYNYIYAENHDVFDEIIGKIALFLSVNNDKGRLNVTSKNLYSETASVDFSAEFYNESFELVNDDDMSIVITGSDGKEYTANFSKQNKGYSLNMGQMPADDYKWKVSIKNGNNTFTKNGFFTVQEIQVEAVNLVANHALLMNISESTNGKFYNVDKFEQISEDIKTDENIIGIARYENKYALMLNSILYFVILILLMGAEWFMRKWEGGY